MRDANSRKYRFARRESEYDLALLCVRRGPEAPMRMAETAAIRGLKPNGNGTNHSKRPWSPIAAITRSRPPASKRTPRDRCSDGRAQKPRGLFDGFGLPREAAQSCTDFSRVPATARSADKYRQLWLWALTFTQAYGQYLRTQSCGGPVDIYQATMWPLLVLYLGTRGAIVDWQRMAHNWQVDCCPLALFPLVGLIKGPARQALARRRIDAQLRFLGLPSSKRIYIKVSQPCVVGCVRHLIRRAVSLSGMPRFHIRWLLSRVVVLTGASKTFLSERGTSKAAKAAEPRDVLKWSSSRLRRALQGARMKMVTKRWDVPIRPSLEELVDNTRQVVCSWVNRWCGNTALRRFLRRGECAGLASHGAIELQQQKWSKSKKEYKEHTKDMRHRSGYRQVQDDKAKKCCWVVSKETFVANLYGYVANSTSWAFSYMSPSTANKRIQTNLEVFVPTRLHKALHISPRTWRLPYVFNTIKGKCFQAGEGKVCDRPGHSCCRKVVSFSAWPAKNTWRSISRAIETVTKRYVPGCETWRLRDAAHDIKTKLQSLQGGATTTCQRCHQAKMAYEGIVADAGQFFESVDSTELQGNMLYVLRQAALASGQSSVTVFKSGRRRAFMGGRPVQRGPTTVTYTFEELFFCMAAYSKVNLYTVGSAVVEASGLPIGGFLSKVACSVVLCVKETEWEKDTEGLIRYGFIRPGMTWSGTVAACRYVDDVCMCSGLLCRHCLKLAVDMMYPVPFDLADSGSQLRWVDLLIDLHCFGVDFHPKGFSTQPAWSTTPRMLRAYILGRIARMREIALPTDRLVHHVTAMLISLGDCGWKKGDFKHVYFSIRGKQVTSREMFVLKAGLRVVAGLAADQPLCPSAATPGT